MDFKVVEVKSKKLVGKSLEMSFTENRTGDLWRSFAPMIKEIPSRAGTDRVSLQIYPNEFMQDPTLKFTKWALVEVSNYSSELNELEQFNFTGGLYAVFNYKGNVIQASIFFKKIFAECIPASVYELDNSRPHFEILPIGKYDPMDENSEEDIYIPIKLKK